MIGKGSLAIAGNPITKVLYISGYISYRYTYSDRGSKNE